MCLLFAVSLTGVNWSEALLVVLSVVLHLIG